ncbi:phage/plasmid replication protein, II/X family [Pollutibacter soli]|uniref:phage/plasmid replication protein, II/X family n=1 Tax=Pollutibacter soli TaxID=3034157 RepID=UPI0030139606
MIDTVILRIHDIAKYSTLIKNLDVQDRNGFTTELGVVDRGEMLSLIKSGYRKPKQFISILRMNRTEDFLVKSKVAKHMNSSNHYELTYFVNYTNNYLELNFSIPKYVFGTNILMFVEHFGDKNYSFHMNVNLEYNIRRSFNLLQKFLKFFFKNEFLFCPVDFKDVEINRIDVCFNQVFKNHDDVIKYLEYQKRITKKYSRNEDGERDEYFSDDDLKKYTTTIMYKTNRYSAKIYMKGDEYKKNDQKQHKKYNERGKSNYFDTEKLQSFANRILRYEITIRNAQLNFLHKKHLFRKNCRHFQRYFEIYNDVLRKEQRNDRLAKKIGAATTDQQEVIRKNYSYEKISPEERKIKRYVSSLFTQKTFFMLDVDNLINIYNEKTVDYKCDKAPFTEPLLLWCMDMLCDFMRQFQVKELQTDEKVRQAIQFYNANHSTKLPETEMIRFYQDVRRIGSFKEVGRFNSLSRATLFRYKSRFRKIGIFENNLIPLTPDSIPDAPLDLREYHGVTTFSPQFLRRNTVFFG